MRELEGSRGRGEVDKPKPRGKKLQANPQCYISNLTGHFREEVEVHRLQGSEKDTTSAWTGKQINYPVTIYQ